MRVFNTFLSIPGSLCCSILNADQLAIKPIPWRSELSKMEIWYATFGSNMWKPRFLCYIQGGQVNILGSIVVPSIEIKTFSGRMKHSLHFDNLIWHAF